MSQPWEALGGGGDRAPDALSGEFQTGGGCTHTHTYTPHTQSHTYTHTFTQAFTHTHSFTHIHSTHPPTHTSYTQHTHTLTHSHTHTQTHTYTQHTQLHPPTHTNHTHTTPTHTLTCTHTHTHTHTQTLKPALSWGTGWRGGRSWAGGRSLAPLRSVYLHNNQLSNAGLPPDAFRGSEAVATLSLSSNQLSYVPPSLPPSLERLHLQVPLSARPLPRPHSPRGPAPPSWGIPCHPSSQKCLWVLSSGMGSSQALSEQPCSKEHLVPYSGAPCASLLPSALDPQSHSLLPSQNNLISKVPRGALSRQTHLRELYLQHNQLTDSGLDATTFRWGLEQGFGGV